MRIKMPAVRIAQGKFVDFLMQFHLHTTDYWKLLEKISLLSLRLSYQKVYKFLLFWDTYVNYN